MLRRDKIAANALFFMYVCFGVVGEKEGNSLKKKKETFIFVSENSLRLHDTHHRIPSTSVYKTPSPNL